MSFYIVYTYVDESLKYVINTILTEHYNSDKDS